MSKQLTEKQQAFLDALFGEAEGDAKVAKDMAGFSPNTPVSFVIGALKDEIIEQARLVLAANAPKAALSMVGVLSDPVAIGNKEKMRAAEQILDRVGVVKTEKVEVNSQEGGVIFVLPPKNG